MYHAVKFCEKHGVKIESDPPNYKIEDEIYLLLAKEFNPDMALKLTAERMAEERLQSQKDARIKSIAVHPSVAESNKISEDLKPHHLSSIAGWANMHYNTSLYQLANLAQKDGENWGKNYRALREYLKEYFKYVIAQDKVEYAGDFAAFNTNLLDEIGGRPIFAIFKKISDPKQVFKWELLSFSILGTGDGKIISSNFDHIPSGVNFCKNRKNLVIDLSDEIVADWNHVLFNICRFPLKFIQEYLPNGMSLPTNLKNRKGKKEYGEQYVNALKADPNLDIRCVDRLEGALDRTKNRISCSIFDAVPYMNSKIGKIQFLLPFCLLDYNTVDVVLVATPTHGRINVETVLTLETARLDARLLGKINCNWLK